jgi:hypothetical protein
MAGAIIGGTSTVSTSLRPVPRSLLKITFLIQSFFRLERKSSRGTGLFLDDFTLFTYENGKQNSHIS